MHFIFSLAHETQAEFLGCRVRLGTGEAKAFPPVAADMTIVPPGA
jgi:hypothetical protein